MRTTPTRCNDYPRWEHFCEATDGLRIYAWRRSRGDAHYAGRWTRWLDNTFDDFGHIGKRPHEVFPEWFACDADWCAAPEPETCSFAWDEDERR